jgi:NAD-dependent SIR2 family protein deacetylase
MGQGPLHSENPEVYAFKEPNSDKEIEELIKAFEKQLVLKD